MIDKIDEESMGRRPERNAALGLISIGYCESVKIEIFVHGSERSRKIILP